MDSFYLSPSFGWTGAIAGGLAFGFGMALVGTCGFGALVRLGGGSLRSLVVILVLGLSALAAQRGLIGYGRIAVVDDLAFDFRQIGADDQSLGSILSALAGIDLRLPTVIVVVAAPDALGVPQRRVPERPGQDHRGNRRSVSPSRPAGSSPPMSPNIRSSRYRSSPHPSSFRRGTFSCISSPLPARSPTTASGWSLGVIVGAAACRLAPPRDQLGGLRRRPRTIAASAGRVPDGDRRRVLAGLHDRPRRVGRFRCSPSRRRSC